jgi:hypothetical protein
VATWTKTELAEKALTYLGVHQVGQSVSANDDALVQAIIDSVYAQARTFGIAPFQLSAIPEWAQWPLTKWVAVESGPAFGKLLPFDIRDDAIKALRAQMQSDKPAMSTKGMYY